MANDLKQILDNIDVAINPNAQPGGILAQNHNAVLKEVLNNSGRFTGLGFNMRKENGGQPIGQGELSWENHNMNETSPFEIWVSYKTIDGNEIKRILDLLLPNALIHIKDFKGRSAYFKYNSYTFVTDTGGNYHYIKLNITGFADNPNYVYQTDEVEFGVIELINVSLPASSNFISDIQIKYFNLYNDYLTNGDPSSFYAGNESFDLANNEIGLFYWKGQENDNDYYDTDYYAFFTKGAGHWDKNNCQATDFITISKSPDKLDYITFGNAQVPLKADYLNNNFNFFSWTTAEYYLNAIQQTKEDAINSLKLSFRWFDDNKINSTRIDGHYRPLEVWFKNWDILQQKDIAIKYYLYIDRWRNHSKKGNRPYNRHSNYRHEIIPDNNGYNSNRINEIEITSERMILDFHQDYYFRAFTNVNDNKGFPAPMGTHRKRQINKFYEKSAKQRLGFVDLAFKIVAKNNNGIFLFETPHLGFIRMTGIMIKNTNSSIKYITYKNIGRL